MIRIHLAMPLLAAPLLATDAIAASEQSENRRTPTRAVQKVNIHADGDGARRTNRTGTLKRNARSEKEKADTEKASRKKAKTHVPAKPSRVYRSPETIPAAKHRRPESWGVTPGAPQSAALFSGWQDISLNWGAQNSYIDVPETGDLVVIPQNLSGPTTLIKQGKGVLRLTGDNTYTGGTIVEEGILQVRGDSHGNLVGDVVNNGLLEFDHTRDVAFAGTISGRGNVHFTGPGTKTLTGNHLYTGHTVVAEGPLQLGDGGTSGSLYGVIYNGSELHNGSELIFNRRDVVIVDNPIHGNGPVTQAGTGTTVLTGNNTYTGVTEVRRGTLFVNGNQEPAKGPVIVRAGATLGGNGTVGGGVLIEDGGTLQAAPTGRILALRNLVMRPDATLRVTVGESSVASPARIRVAQNVELDGMLDIDSDGEADRGVHRLIEFKGELTDRTIEIRTVPQGSRPEAWRIDASRHGRIDLINDGGRPIRYWDDYACVGCATWQAGGHAYWSDGYNSANTAWVDDAMAVFSSTPYTVRVIDSTGPVRFSGAQFTVDGYIIDGPGTLITDTPDTVLRVGGIGSESGSPGARDTGGGGASGRPGSSDDADVDGFDNTGSGTGNIRATIRANIVGPGGITKTDAGTLRLEGMNSYSGNTTLKAGTLEINRDANLGAPTGTLIFNGGVLRTKADIVSARPVTIQARGGIVDTKAHTLRWTGPLTGSGVLTKGGTGTLELAGANTADGGLNIAAGTVRAGASDALGSAMRYTVANGATLDTAGLPQTVAGLINAGTVTMGSSTGDSGTSNSGAMSAGLVGNTLTVRGGYVGQNGELRLRTTLGDSNSPSDRLIIDGGHASGHTRVTVINMNGLGALTQGNGIEVIRAINGATTTAQTTRDAFVLQGGHVDAGAYEYRLHAGDAYGAGENWYLRSTLPAPETPDTSGTSGTSNSSGASGGGEPNDPQVRGMPVRASGQGRVAYRPEVALYAALPAVLAQTDLAMLGNRHQREGDDAASAITNLDGSQRRVWGRIIDWNSRIRQHGTVTSRSDGWASGGQVGVDLLTTTRHRIGVYGGTLGWRSKVHGDASGISDKNVGNLQGRTNYAGAYWTYTADTGWYSDLVLQHGHQRGKANSVSGNDGDIRGHSTLASLEAGMPLRVSPRWSAEPQAQLIATNRRIDDASIPEATIKQHPDNAVVARIGLRLKGEYNSAYGHVLPYTRLNVWHGLPGTDSQTVKGPAGSAHIDTRRGFTSGEIAAGSTWIINRRVGLYGEVGHLFPLGGEQRMSARHAISAGVRIAW